MGQVIAAEPQRRAAAKGYASGTPKRRILYTAGLDCTVACPSDKRSVRRRIADGATPWGSQLRMRSISQV